MTKRMLLMLGIVAAVLGAVFGAGAFRSMMIKRFMATTANPIQTVSATVAEYSEWQPQIAAVGSLRAERGADLAAQVAGIVTAIHFRSGQDVRAGAALIDLYADDDIALLHSLQAQAQLAQINYDRDRKQLAAKAISQAQVDTDLQNLKVAQAQVAQQRAVIAKKRIAAPFAGRLGIRQVDLGQYLSAGTTIVTLQSLNPIFVDFYVPQQQLAQLQVGQDVAARTDTYPGKSFSGRLFALNSAVDSSTRNVLVRAELDNTQHLLLPGMYATVEVASGKPQRYLTLPQTAIVYNPYGDTVYLVEKKTEHGKTSLSARQTFVTVGPTRGDQIAVLEGVKRGEQVVTSGQIKLRNGTPLAIDNSVAPSDRAHPQITENQ
ncbi:MAG: efflux RND transporter periplasmic adaptor subunit [Gammaproteobacteria bacterium]|nr:efflux RND transporter periplasmic adaptor subunit [Gammaproteobacteria bacterium]